MRCTIGYETPFISLREACPRIAEALEAQGWPAKPNASFVALRQAQIALVEYDEATSLLDRMKNTANRNPAFAPAVLQAGRLSEEAKRRLESAHKQQELSREPPQPGSYEEATRQLDLACRDGAIAVSGDLVVKSAEGPVLQSECEIPAAEIREVSVAKRIFFTDGGTVINVNLRIEDIDKICPRPADNAVASAVEAPAISPSAPPPRAPQREIANALKRYLSSESAAGRPANIDRAVSSIKEQLPRATRSQIREIYRTEVPQPRGRPRKNRR